MGHKPLLNILHATCLNALTNPYNDFSKWDFLWWVVEKVIRPDPSSIVLMLGPKYVCEQIFNKIL